MLLIGQNVSDNMKATLRDLGTDFAVMPECGALVPPLSSHPDMAMIGIEDRFFTCPDMYVKMLPLFKKLCVELVDTGERHSPLYPKDILFNGFTLDKSLFCNTKGFSKIAAGYAEEVGFKVIHTNQGYAKCSTLKIDESHVVTADRGLAALLSDFCDVLCISEGFISLPPYSYGFIGGASAVVGDKVLFFGDLSSHPDALCISDFIDSAGKTAVSLSNEPLCDCGGGFII